MSDILALLKTFVRTVEAGSFSAVARELNSSQPTVSRQIATLEDHLGALLFQRTTRALTLTDDGRVFYEHARRTIEALTEAESAVGRRKGKPSGRLRLACAAVFGRLHVIPRLPRFRARFPDIEIALAINDGFSDLVEEGIDLAIRVGEPSESTLISRRIGTTRRVVVATPEYLAARGRPEHPRDLAGHDCIVYDRLLAGANWTFVAPGGALTVPVAGPVHVNNTEAVRAAVLQGLGIGYVPVWHFVEGEIETGRLVVLLRAFEPPAQPISAVYPSRRFVPTKVRAAIEYFAAEFELDPYLRIDPL
jgi:DNA-binding transcriptional LysR family regulator